MTAGDDWRARIAALDGHDLEETLALARAIIAARAWRSWMPRAFMRVHRHEVTRLMRRLGPMIPALRTQTGAVAPAPAWREPAAELWIRARDGTLHKVPRRPS